MILAAVLFMVAALKPDFATFLPQIFKVIIAGILLLVGLYLMWKERQW